MFLFVTFACIVYRQDANRQLQRFVASILSLLQELNRCRDSPLDREIAEFLLLRLGDAMCHMHQAITFVERSPEFSQIDVNNLRQLSRRLSLIEDLFRALPVITPSSYCAPVSYTGAVGRPSYDISREQIMLLRSVQPATFLTSDLSAGMETLNFTIFACKYT